MVLHPQGQRKQKARRADRKDKTKTVFKDNQGHFYRIPKPKPAPPAQDDADDADEEEGYESCEEMDPRRVALPLMQQAQEVATQVQDQDPALAALLAALCDSLERVDEQRRSLRAQNDDLIECVGSLKSKLGNKRTQLKEQQAANANLRGQSTRYWTRIRKLQRQLYRSRVDKFDPPPQKTLIS